MRRKKQTLFAFLQSESASILMIAAIAIPVLLAAAGLAVDLNRRAQTSGVLQSAVDQAAIAATAVDGQNRDTVVRNFMEAALPDDLRQNVNISVAEDFPPGGPLSVTVTATVQMNNMFGGFVGMDTTSITRTSQVERAVENVEAVLALANSGTMCSHKSHAMNANGTVIQLSPDPTCKHYNDMKLGVMNFLDIMENNQTITDFKVGFVPFNHKVRMPNLGNIPPSLSAGEEPGFFSDTSDMNSLGSVMPLTDNIAAARSILQGYNNTVNDWAWSRTDLPSHVAGLMLDPASHRFFGGGLRPEPIGSPNTTKLLVLMTDGSNLGCCFTNWPIGNFSNQFVYFYEPYNIAQRDICTRLKANGVRIFTILFGVSNLDPGGVQINEVFAECASGPWDNPGGPARCNNKQFCYDVTETEDLVRAYREIAETFYEPIITQ